MEENRKYLGKEKLILCNFSLRYTPKIAMENIFVIKLFKKKKRKSICLETLKKLQIPRLQAALLG